MKNKSDDYITYYLKDHKNKIFDERNTINQRFIVLDNYSNNHNPPYDDLL